MTDDKTETFQIRVRDKYVVGTSGRQLNLHDGVKGLKNFKSAGTAFRYFDGYVSCHTKTSDNTGIIKVEWMRCDPDYPPDDGERVAFMLSLETVDGDRKLIRSWKKQTNPAHRTEISFQLSNRALTSISRVFDSREKAEKALEQLPEICELDAKRIESRAEKWHANPISQRKVRKRAEKLGWDPHTLGPKQLWQQAKTEIKQDKQERYENSLKTAENVRKRHSFRVEGLLLRTVKEVDLELLRKLM